MARSICHDLYQQIRRLTLDALNSANANAELRLPSYLNADVEAYLTERGAEKGVPLGEMVNALLKQET